MYGVLFELVLDPQKLRREKICNAQKRLGDTLRFQDLSRSGYVVPGKARAATEATFASTKPVIMQFCPSASLWMKKCHMAKVSAFCPWPPISNTFGLEPGTRLLLQVGSVICSQAAIRLMPMLSLVAALITDTSPGLLGMGAIGRVD